MIFALAAYFLEPYRRILAGVSVGLYLGLAIGYALGTGTFISVLLAVVGGLIFGVAVPMVFDLLVIVVTAVNGAAMVVDGANMILDVSWLDRFSISTGGQMIALLLWIGLAMVGLFWQYRNIERWVRSALKPIS